MSPCFPVGMFIFAGPENCRHAFQRYVPEIVPKGVWFITLVWNMWKVLTKIVLWFCKGQGHQHYTA